MAESQIGGLGVGHSDGPRQARAIDALISLVGSLAWETT